MVSPFLKKKKVIVLSLGFALFLILVLTLSILLKTPPKKRAANENIPAVIAQDSPLIDYTIYAKAYGTVQPAKTMMLDAPFAGAAQLSSSLQKGSYLKEGQNIFLIDIKQIENQRKSLLVSLEDIGVKEKKLTINNELLEIELINAQNLKKLIDEELVKMDAQKENAYQLYLKSKSLFEQKALSEKSFIEEENKLKNIELAFIQSKKSLETSILSTKSLSLKLDKISLEKSEIDQDKQKIMLDLSTLDSDIEKANVNALKSSQILDLYVEDRQEVLKGTRLAKLNLLGEVIIPILLPDYYFKWLYKGPLLKNSNVENIQITLVNPLIKKVFDGGYIKCISGELDPKTRSLCIMIGKKNPLSPNSTPLIDQELLPGSYCFVMLPLDTLKEVYIIPRSSIQRDGMLYLIDSEMKMQKSSYKTLYEDQNGIVISLPTKEKNITIITHPVSNIQEGMRVKRDNS